MKPAIDNSAPPSYSHLQSQRKKAQTEIDWKTNVERENVMLLKKMEEINRKPSTLDNWNPNEHSRSLNSEKRRREAEKIQAENEAFLRRMITNPPAYSRNEWEKEREKQIKYLKNKAEYPVLDSHIKIGTIKKETSDPSLEERHRQLLDMTKSRERPRSLSPPKRESSPFQRKAMSPQATRATSSPTKAPSSQLKPVRKSPSSPVPSSKSPTRDSPQEKSKRKVARAPKPLSAKSSSLQSPHSTKNPSRKQSAHDAMAAAAKAEVISDSEGDEDEITKPPPNADTFSLSDSDEDSFAGDDKVYKPEEEASATPQYGLLQFEVRTSSSMVEVFIKNCYSELRAVAEDNSTKPRWNFIREKYKTWIYENRYSDVPSCKGEGLLEITPQVTILREVNVSTRILYVRSRSKFNSLPRDLTLLVGYEGPLSDGSYTLIMRSIDLSNPVWGIQDPRTPLPEERLGYQYESHIISSQNDSATWPVLRTQVFNSGFIIRPVQCNGHLDKASHLTFVFQHSIDLLPTAIAHKSKTYFPYRVARIRQSLPEELKLKKEDLKMSSGSVGRRRESERSQSGKRYSSGSGSESESTYSSSWSSSEDEPLLPPKITHVYPQFEPEICSEQEMEDATATESTHDEKEKNREEWAMKAISQMYRDRSDKRAEKYHRWSEKIDELSHKLTHTNQVSRHNTRTGFHSKIVFFCLLLWSLMAAPLLGPINTVLVFIINLFKTHLPGFRTVVLWVEALMPRTFPYKLVSNVALLFTLPFFRWLLATGIKYHDGSSHHRDVHRARGRTNTCK
ncbi:hypothetical protein PROFUN_14068 [Planoprotostelium fungivorum]|uniref:Uncharacterized protein n=1 Tax=Planoprotostelium fungivorum TaxID=1890364 RepID=A0A2P6N1Y1_9EUKA|nr:hypothetical protein PROFUN_14068 [Planoprotostelium fungivorum]